MLFGPFIKWQAVQQHMRDDARCQSGNSVATIPADILGCPSQFGHIERNRRGWDDDIADWTECRNTTTLYLMEDAYFSLGHTWRRFFDGIACSLPLYKNNRMARLSAPHD